jgi:hypothetical protein
MSSYVLGFPLYKIMYYCGTLIYTKAQSQTRYLQTIMYLYHRHKLYKNKLKICNFKQSYQIWLNVILKLKQI